MHPQAFAGSTLTQAWPPASHVVHVSECSLHAYSLQNLTCPSACPVCDHRAPLGSVHLSRDVAPCWAGYSAAISRHWPRGKAGTQHRGRRWPAGLVPAPHRLVQCVQSQELLPCPSPYPVPLPMPNDPCTPSEEHLGGDQQQVS